MSRQQEKKYVVIISASDVEERWRGGAAVCSGWRKEKVGGEVEPAFTYGRCCSYEIWELRTR